MCCVLAADAVLRERQVPARPQIAAQGQILRVHLRSLPARRPEHLELLCRCKWSIVVYTFLVLLFERRTVQLLTLHFCGVLDNCIVSSSLSSGFPVSNKCTDYWMQDVIANVPPHWNEGILEDHGSRWAGQVR